MKLYNIACDSHVSGLQDGVYFVLQMCSDKSYMAMQIVAEEANSDSIQLAT